MHTHHALAEHPTSENVEAHGLLETADDNTESGASVLAVDDTAQQQPEPATAFPETPETPLDRLVADLQNPSEPYGVNIQRVMCYVNGIRARFGLAPLATTDALNAAAASYSRVLSDNDAFVHTYGNTTIDQRLTKAGVGFLSESSRDVNENLARYFPSLDAMFQSWIDNCGKLDAKAPHPS